MAENQEENSLNLACAETQVPDPPADDEVLDSGKPAPATPQKPNEEPKVPDAPKKKRAAVDPEKKKKKKAVHKGLVSASPSLDSAPRNYYDIQNFTINVSRGEDVSSAMQAIDVPLPGYTTTSNGNIRVKAPPPPIPHSPTVKFDLEEEYDQIMTYPGRTKLIAEPTFCPDCSMRITLHKVRPATNKDKTKNYKLFVCPGVKADE